MKTAAEAARMMTKRTATPMAKRLMNKYSETAAWRKEAERMRNNDAVIFRSYN